MGLRQRRRRVSAIAIAVATILVATSACDSNADQDSENITLTVSVFGDQGFGYDNLYETYMDSHPNITIVEQGKGTILSDHLTNLTEELESGIGAADIVAAEESTLLELKDQPEYFVNLYDYGAGSLESNFLSWKWSQGLTADGKELLGLGTDIGSMAICYRKDLFEKAGLPSDRESVGELWNTWEEFIATGKTFTSKMKSSSVKFVDSVSNFYTVVASQLAGSGTGYLYFDTSDRLVISSNADVQQAWDLTMQMIDSGLSAGLESYSTDWQAAFQQSQFATIACPAWMTGVVEAQSGEAFADQWDIAQAPGNGGNMGGSFLMVTEQSEHPAEAAELAMYLTSIEGQISAFSALGNLPSNPRALQDPSILEYTNDYFNDAPTGQIFAEGATDLEPVYLGPKTQQIRDAIDDALAAVESGQRTSDTAWQELLTTATRVATE